MYERPSLFRDPKRQIFLAVLITVVLYVLFLGRQGVVSDVLVEGSTAYTAVGRYGGVRVLNIENPTEPREIGFYDTPGGALRLSRAANYLLVADGTRGVRILEVSNPAMPVSIGIITTKGSVQDVVVHGSYAYAALGEDGLAVVDLSNPSRPLVAGSMDSPGSAQRIGLVDTGGSAPYIYLADGRGGLHVVDVRLPISPRIVYTYDEVEEVRDVAIRAPLAVIAAGRQGVRVLNILNPELPFTHTGFDTPGEATAIDVVGSLVYVADGSAGVQVVEFANAANPVLVSSFPTPGSAQMVEVVDGHIYIADGSQGLRILDQAAPYNPDQMGIYETPGEASFRQLLSAGVSIFTGRWADIPGKVWRTLGIIFFDVLLFFGVLFFWLFVFGQFVMPVRSLTERWQVTERLVSYFTGGHGPAVFVRNGSIREGAQEKHRRGPGVALLDTASAALLRNAHAFIRPVGPGVVFTSGAEYFASAVDLHPQLKNIGPRDGEDPFAPRLEHEDLFEYEMRQKNRYLTSALTRDGVEIVPNISVAFKFISEPGQGNTLFGYNPSSVWNAIVREGINPAAAKESDSRYVAWDWLPIYLAADLWREYLRKFTLDELFRYISNQPVDQTVSGHHTAFNTILKMMRARLTEPKVKDLDELGKPIDGDPLPSKEYCLLRERGIRLLDVSVRYLRFPQKVEEQLLAQWQTTWLNRVKEDRKEINRLNAYYKGEGQEAAYKNFAAAVSQTLVNRLADEPGGLNMEETLEELLIGTLRLCIREPDLQTSLAAQKAGLVEMIDWTRRP
jgi:hypothetical protein